MSISHQNTAGNTPSLQSLTNDFLSAKASGSNAQVLSTIKLIEQHYGIAAVRSLPSVKKGTWGENHE